MLEIAIKDGDKTPMWSVPGTRLFLSFESPGPITVDINTLTPDQKKIIAQDISRGTLVGKNTDELLVAVAGHSKDPTLPGHKGSPAKSYSKIRLVRDEEEGYNIKVTDRPPVIVEQPIDPQEERRAGLRAFLDKHVATVKKELSGRSLSELRILRDIELHDKNRGSVIKLIDQLISKAQSEVFNSIQKSFNPNAATPNEQDLPKQYLENITGVVESEYQDVTIKLGADDDE
jgi:hypothetical protein